MSRLQFFLLFQVVRIERCRVCFTGENILAQKLTGSTRVWALRELPTGSATAPSTAVQRGSIGFPVLTRSAALAAQWVVIVSILPTGTLAISFSFVTILRHITLDFS